MIRSGGRDFIPAINEPSSSSASKPQERLPSSMCRAVQVRASIAEGEAMPRPYAAELIGVGGDSEKAIRWLIALMVRCCDPLAIALAAVVSARRSNILKPY